MAAPLYDNLADMSREELMVAYNGLARSTQVGLNFYREELWRRDLAEVQRASGESTKTTERLTWAILVLTLANVILVAVQLRGLA